LRHAGLALAIGLGACLNALILYRTLRKHAVFAPRPGWQAFGLRLAVAVAVMAAVLWFAAGPGSWWMAAGWQARLLRLLGVVAAGATVYFASLWLLGFRLRDFQRRGVAE
jgi:putative peptidoglycan lipid II flippase